jgi:hypothetical protein
MVLCVLTLFRSILFFWCLLLFLSGYRLHQQAWPSKRRCVWVEVIIFGSVRFLSKKVTKLNLKKKPKPVQTDRFRFGFLNKKPVQTVWLGVFSLARFWLCVFPVWVRFSLVFSV